MKFRGMHSYPSHSPYAPQWNADIGMTMVDDIDLDLLSTTCLEKEREINKHPVSIDDDGEESDGGTGLGRNATTAKFQHYNVLKWNTNETNKLKYIIKKKLVEYNNNFNNKTPVEIWIHCWVNIMRWGQKIKPHFHRNDPYSYLSGHFSVQVNNTSTCYMSPINQLNNPDIIENPNVPGNMTLFPSYIHHYTTRHYSFKPRITIAFDLNIKKTLDNSILL